MTNEEIVSKIQKHFVFKSIVSTLANIEGCCLAGGAIRDVIIGEQPKDYDFFFTSEKALKEALYLMKNYKSEGNMYTNTYKTEDGDIQLIVKDLFIDMECIIQAFDFTPIQLAYGHGSVAIGKNTLEDIEKEHVGVNVITKPLSSLCRLERYTGYTGSDGTVKGGWDIEKTYRYILDVMCDSNPKVILNAQRYDFE